MIRNPLESVTLSLREWRAVGELAQAGDDLEPLAMRKNVGPIVVKRLVTLGIAEMGPSAARFSREAFPIGYRLSRLGQMILRRGRRAPAPQPVARPTGPQVVVIRRPRVMKRP